MISILNVFGVLSLIGGILLLIGLRATAQRRASLMVFALFQFAFGCAVLLLIDLLRLRFLAYPLIGLFSAVNPLILLIIAKVKA